MGDCGNPFGRARFAYARRGADRRRRSDQPGDRAGLDRARLGLATLLILAAVGMLIAAPRAQAQTAPCAELVIDAVGVAPTPPVPGQPSTIDVTVRNAGTCAAAAFTVDWRGALFAPTGPSAPVSGLGAGVSTVVNLPYVFTQLGLSLAFARVDTTNAVPETNEFNNTFFRFVSVPPAVDLVVTDLTVTPPIPVRGQPATVSITVKNQGSVAAGDFRVDWSPGFLAAGIPLQVAGLAAGTSTTLTQPFLWPTAGAFDTTATADAGGSVAESDEFNNSKFLRVTVVADAPDLVITDVVLDPNPAVAGSAVKATVTVKNEGVAPAGAFTVRWQPWLLAVPLTTQVSGLGVGASTVATFSYVVPSVGVFNGAATVDSTGAVAEINEGNNARTTQFTGVLPTLNVERVAQGGFGDSQNSYSWSMAWFKGKLYVGTARSQHCVEAATLDFFFPGQGWYLGPLDGLPEANCPPNYYDLNLRAEIWQYTPETETWKRVHQSETVPNPRAPGKVIARDIGYRGMVVYTDPSTGQEGLYVGSVTADEYVPELAEPYPPRILRSVDGETFTPLPTSPGIINNTSGAQRPIGFRAMAAFDGRLLVTASGGLGGDGVILEVKNPSSPSPTYVQVSPNTFQVYEMEEFNGKLWVGTSAPSGGYYVKKITDMSTVPFQYTDVVTDGAGRGSQITSVVSMHVFKGRLYVGANGWAQGGQSVLRAEEIRINPDESWDVVAGATRTLPDGTTKAPISGFGDGFGNFLNVHMWWAETHNGAMYLGTNDASGAWQDPRLGPIPALLAPEFGFDIWGTCDGQYWWRVTRNAFGDGKWNFGARSLKSTPFGLFIGSTNLVEGTSVWKGDASPCGSGGGDVFGPIKRVEGSSGSGGQQPAAAEPARASLVRPGALLAEVQPCGTALSWEPAPGAKSYRILRSEYRALNFSFAPPPRLPNGQILPDAMPMPALPGSGGAATRRVEVAGPSVVIGTTTKTTFVDRSAKPGGRYNYEVVAVDASGRASQPSNVATTSLLPSDTPFVGLDTAIRRLIDKPGKHSSGSVAGSKLVRLANVARTTWRETGPAGALDTLGQLRDAVEAQRANARGAARTTALRDVREAVVQLERRMHLAAACKR